MGTRIRHSRANVHIHLQIMLMQLAHRGQHWNRIRRKNTVYSNGTRLYYTLTFVFSLVKPGLIFRWTRDEPHHRAPWQGGHLGRSTYCYPRHGWQAAALPFRITGCKEGTPGSPGPRWDPVLGKAHREMGWLRDGTAGSKRLGRGNGFSACEVRGCTWKLGHTRWERKETGHTHSEDPGPNAEATENVRGASPALSMLQTLTYFHRRTQMRLLFRLNTLLKRSFWPSYQSVHQFFQFS